MYLKEKKASKEIYESNLVYIDEEITGEVDDEGFCKPIKTEIKVKRLSVMAILRDWSKGKALRDSKYPPSQIQVVKLKLWSEEKQKEFIENKIKGLIAAEAKKEKDLPPCSPEDRWSKKDTYAVMKIGGKKALRVLATAEDAGKWAESYTVSNPKAKIEVQKREGGDIRCGDYCSCNKFCDYYKKKYGKQKPQEGQK